MLNIFFRFIFLTFFISAASFIVNAQQVDMSGKGGDTQREDLPKGIKETLAKGRIEREKKTFAELIERGEEAIKLSDELEKSFVQNNQLSSDDRKKLDRLEKLVKKIRTEIGGKDEATNDNSDSANQPLSIQNALKFLQTNTIQLVDELKKTTRYSISVAAVESSNLLLSVVRFLRFRKN
jgi:Mg2+ and Co2+ transporter CorA